MPAETIAPYPYTVYTRPGCPYSARAKSILDAAEVPYEEFSLDGAPVPQELVDRSGIRTVPQIFDATGLFLGDSEAIELLLLGDLFARADGCDAAGPDHREAARAFVDMCGGWGAP